MIEKIGNLLRTILPLGNGGKAMIALVVFVALFLTLLAMHARAGEPESYVQVSTGRAVVRGQTSALNVAWSFPSPQAAGDAWVVSTTLIGASDFRGLHAPNNYAFDVTYVTGLKRLDIGLGPSWMERPSPYNGSHINFTLQLGYRFQRWPITVWWKHFSCGGACEPNWGRDLLLLGWRL